MIWLHDAFAVSFPGLSNTGVDEHSTHSKIVFGEVRLRSGFLSGSVSTNLLKRFNFLIALQSVQRA